MYRMPHDVAALFAKQDANGILVTRDRIIESIKGDEALRPSFKQLYDGLVMAMAQNEHMTESNTSDLFANISRSVVLTEVMQGYSSVDKVGPNLVRTVPTPGRRTGQIGRSTFGEQPKEVGENEDYPKVGLLEKYVTFENKKYGLALELSKEAVMEDQTGTVLDNAQSVGRRLAEMEEDITLQAITDQTGYESYYPAGTQTALFSTTASPQSKTQTPANNQIVNALTDWTDFDLAHQTLGSKIGEDGRPIAAGSSIGYLGPWALRGTAQYIQEQTKDTRANRSANKPPIFVDMPGGMNHTPFLDQISNTEWYLGDFKRQYVKTVYWPLTTEFLPGENDSALLLRDTFGVYKASIFFDVVATDFRFVVKNTSS